MSPIVGPRYKCLTCHNFDLCEKCEPKHEHNMIKFKKSNDTTKSHVGITCDGCGKKPITGVRYKCLHCPNFDLCEECEPNHEHSMLKLKQPIRQIRGPLPGLREFHCARKANGFKCRKGMPPFVRKMMAGKKGKCQGGMPDFVREMLAKKKCQGGPWGQKPFRCPWQKKRMNACHKSDPSKSVPDCPPWINDFVSEEKVKHEDEKVKKTSKKQAKKQIASIKKHAQKQIASIEKVAKKQVKQIAKKSKMNVKQIKHEAKKKCSRN